MWQIFFTLNILFKLQSMVIAIPIVSEEPLKFNITELKNVNQVIFIPDENRDISKEFKVVAFRRVNWYAALQTCSAYGLNLASINTGNENAKLQQYLFQIGLFGESIWTSGNILSHQNSWFWMSNGNALYYTNWDRNEPNTFRGQKECLIMNSSGKWNANNCYKPSYFVCENRCPLSSYDVPLLYPSRYDLPLYPPGK